MTEWVTTCTKGPEWLDRSATVAEVESPALVIVWSAAEPWRVGEVAFVDTAGRTVVLGRGGSAAGDRQERLQFFRQRGGILQPTSPLAGDGISRHQCELRAASATIAFSAIGRCPMSHNGHTANQGQLAVGDLLTIKDQLILICVSRLPQFKQRYFESSGTADFGQPDRSGIVGESQAIWELREELAFCAVSDKHVLILGESGAGKELAAHAIHQMSPRAQRAMVARNAATFPAALIDAELFGNAPNYPNAGMPARPGVIGEAHQSSLLLDEIGELPHELQAHLLRVLDSGGEYQRLGDAQLRRSDLRLLAATNRDPTELRTDMLGRLTLQVQMPSLRDRREDIPLLLQHLLLQAARTNSSLQQRFCADTRHGIKPRFDPDLIEVLVCYPYSYNIRELDALLWKAVAGSRGEYVALTPELRKGSLPVDNAEAPPAPYRSPELAPAAIVDALTHNGHNVVAAARELGLSSRYALYRLMRKYGIAVERVE